MKIPSIRAVPIGALLFLSTLDLPFSTCFAQGSLTPPGAPAPTMKTLSQVEPRTPISSLPFTITNSGSYYLTTNLMGMAGFAGISIQTNDVTLDLSGYAMIGVPGVLHGIRTLGAERFHIAIRNGTVRNWQIGVDFGAFGGRGCRIESLSVSHNLSYGIVAARSSVIKDCTASFNGADGISTAGGCAISSCTVSSNLTEGISVNEGDVIHHCSAQGNGTAGIQAIKRAYVFENNCSGNGIGIRISNTENRVENNHVSANGYGIYANIFPNLIIRNSATSNTTNYFIMSSIAYGPTNFVSGVITNLNPWANFSY